MRIFFTFLCFSLSLTLFAQLEISRINHVPMDMNANSKTFSKLNGSVSDTLSLPFWDDFSYYTGVPDTNKWELGSGVWVNTGLSLAPVSTGIASFDGLNAFGKPYDFNDNFPKGTADVLTSLPIDLSNFNINEEVFMSFFWQQAGLGESPDAKQGDSLIVEFKKRINDSTFVWDGVWAQIAVDSLELDTFFFVNLKLDDTSYFKNDFQFRFRNRGTLSGAFDNWHIDYVFMDFSRFFGDRYWSDRTIIKEEGRIFRDFTCVPHGHIPNDSLFQYLQKSNSVSSRTLDSLFSTYRLKVIFAEDSGGTFIENYTEPNATLIQSYLKRENEEYSISEDSVNAFNFDNTKDYSFSQSFILTANSDIVFPGYNSLLNDTVRYFGTLSNYYAYDDGSPELGVGIRTPYGKVALEYKMYKRDTLTGIDIAFIPGERNINETEIGIRVWSALERENDPILYSKDIIGSFSTDRNGFIRVNFDSAIICEGTIYIGWVQFDKTFLNVGYDMNNRFNDKIYTKVDPTAGWKNESEFDYPGAMMLRPVFDSVGVPIAQANNIPNDPGKTTEVPYELKLYPNPNTGSVILDNYCDSFFITDLSGQLQIKGSQKNQGDRINLEDLPNGTYIATFIFQGQRSVQRLLIMK